MRDTDEWAKGACTRVKDTGPAAKKEKFALRSGLSKEYSEERHSRQADQRERWQAEHLRHEAAEKKLSDVSKFSYDPEDYVKFLVKEPFREPARIDYSPLLAERMVAAELRFFRPINIRWGLMAALILSLAVLPYLATLAVVLALLAAVGYSQYKLLQQRQQTMEKTESQARLEIETKTREQDERIAEQRRVFEQAEEERIDYYVKLMNGDESVVYVAIDDVLPKLKVPFPMEMDVDFYAGVVLIKAWLPPKTIIPAERTSLTELGRIQYEKKDSTEINKQYAELCAAILMQISTLMFSQIPTIGRVYVWGMSKEGERDECILMTMQMDRFLLERVSRAPTALVALQGLSAKYSCDEFLKLMPVEPLVPDGWSEIEPKRIRNLHIKISR